MTPAGVEELQLGQGEVTGENFALCLMESIRIPPNTDKRGAVFRLRRTHSAAQVVGMLRPNAGGFEGLRIRRDRKSGQKNTQDMLDRAIGYLTEPTKIN